MSTEFETTVIQALGAIQSQLTSNGALLTSVRTEMSTLQTEVSSHGAQLASHGAQLSSLRTEMTSLRADLMERMDRQQHRMDSLDQHLSMGLGHTDELRRGRLPWPRATGSRPNSCGC